MITTNKHLSRFPTILWLTLHTFSTRQPHFFIRTLHIILFQKLYHRNERWSVVIDFQHEWNKYVLFLYTVHLQSRFALSNTTAVCIVVRTLWQPNFNCLFDHQQQHCNFIKTTLHNAAIDISQPLQHLQQLVLFVQSCSSFRHRPNDHYMHSHYFFVLFFLHFVFSHKQQQSFHTLLSALADNSCIKWFVHLHLTA